MGLTKKITWAAMCWLKYVKNADIVCTEIGHHYLKDVCGLWIGNDGLPSSMVEIEVKISMSDLRADFINKEKKHEWYSQGRHSPNYLYYAFPQSLAEEGKEFLKEKNKKYGVLSFNSEKDHEGYFVDSFMSIHRCQKLTLDRPSPAYMHQIEAVFSQMMKQKKEDER